LIKLVNAGWDILKRRNKMKYVLIGMWRIVSIILMLPIILIILLHAIGKEDMSYYDKFIDKYFKWI